MGLARAMHPPSKPPHTSKGSSPAALHATEQKQRETPAKYCGNQYGVCWPVDSDTSTMNNMCINNMCINNMRIKAHFWRAAWSWTLPCTEEIVHETHAPRLQSLWVPCLISIGLRGGGGKKEVLASSGREKPAHRFLRSALGYCRVKARSARPLTADPGGSSEPFKTRPLFSFWERREENKGSGLIRFSPDHGKPSSLVGWRSPDPTSSAPQGGAVGSHSASLKWLLDRIFSK